MKRLITNFKTEAVQGKNIYNSDAGAHVNSLISICGLIRINNYLTLTKLQTNKSVNQENNQQVNHYSLK